MNGLEITMELSHFGNFSLVRQFLFFDHTRERLMASDQRIFRQKSPEKVAKRHEIRYNGDSQKFYSERILS